MATTTAANSSYKIKIGPVPTVVGLVLEAGAVVFETTLKQYMVCDGTTWSPLLLEPYADTYWDDIRTPSNLSKKVPGKEAKDQAYKGGVVISFEDGADQAISFNVQLPHAWKTASDIEFHIHVALPTAGSGAGAENVKFDFTHSWASINAELPTETTVSVITDIQDFPADTHKLIEIAGTIDASAITGVSSMMICSLTRDVSVADNYADDVYLLEVDFHYEIDTPGSREEYVK